MIGFDLSGQTALSDQQTVGGFCILTSQGIVSGESA